MKFTKGYARVILTEDTSERRREESKETMCELEECVLQPQPACEAGNEPDLNTSTPFNKELSGVTIY